MIKLVIFDLDGTLLNTLEDLANSVNYALTKFGYPEHQINDYKYFVGNGMRKLVEKSLPENERSEQNIDKLLEVFLSYYNEHKIDNTAPYYGIIELLKEIQNKKIKLAVASNKMDEAVQPLMEKYFEGIDFEVSFGQRQGVPTKPNPAIVHDILKITGNKEEEVLYIGDSGVDMKTAVNANLKSVGVTWGFRDKEELKKGGATYFADYPKQILEIIEKL